MPARTCSKTSAPSMASPRWTTESPTWDLGPELGASDALDLQDVMGNQAVGGLIQRSASGGAEGDPGARFGAATAGAGQQVPFREEMEAALGRDFSGVEAHMGQAGPLGCLGAKAAAQGEQVAFAEASPSKETVAHELTHVVQQEGGAGGVAPLPEVSAPGDASEREAAEAGRMVAAGGTFQVEEAPSGQIQGGWWQDLALGASNIMHNVAEGVGLESADEANAARLQAFRDHGLFGPQELVPPTNIGGFTASFDPQAMVLEVAIKGGVDFTDGLALDESTGVISSNTSDLDQAALDGMALPDLDSKRAFVDDFKWGDKATWLANLNSRVSAAWQAGYTFTCTRPGWETMVATTRVQVDMHEGAKGGNEHIQVTVYKVPPDGSYDIGAYVDGDADDVNNAFDEDPHNNAMVLGSNDVENGPDVPSLLRRSVQFANDSTALDGAATSTLDMFAVDFQDANLDKSSKVKLIGRASTSGSEAYNKKKAQERIDAVSGYLASKGFTDMADRVTTDSQGETGAGAGVEWCRVDLEVNGGRGQFVAAHEFGHAFGLMDEYSVNPGGWIGGTGLPVGTVSGHDQLARDIGAPGSVAENNDNTMSLGSVVRPQHFATFGWALRTITRVNEWQVG